MKEIERIEDQLKRAFEGGAWHGPSVSECLVDIAATSAAAKLVAGAHSIWEIVLHIAAWQQAVRRRLEGEIVELSPEEDWPAVKDTSEAAWRAALEALERSYEELQRAISRLADTRLDEVVAGKDDSVYVMLHGVVQHDLYHAGQIGLLRKSFQHVDG